MSLEILDNRILARCKVTVTPILVHLVEKDLIAELFQSQLGLPIQPPRMLHDHGSNQVALDLLYLVLEVVFRLDLSSILLILLSIILASLIVDILIDACLVQVDAHLLLLLHLVILLNVAVLEYVISLGQGIEELQAQFQSHRQPIRFLSFVPPIRNRQLLPHGLDPQRIVLGIHRAVCLGCYLSHLKSILQIVVFFKEFGDLDSCFRLLQGIVVLIGLKVVLEDLEGFLEVLQAIVAECDGRWRVLLRLFELETGVVHVHLACLDVVGSKDAHATPHGSFVQVGCVLKLIVKNE